VVVHKQCDHVAEYSLLLQNWSLPFLRKAGPAYIQAWASSLAAQPYHVLSGLTARVVIRIYTKLYDTIQYVYIYGTASEAIRQAKRQAKY